MSLPCTVCRTISKIEFKTPEADIYRCPACQHCFSDILQGNDIQYDTAYYTEDHKNWFKHPNFKLFEKIYRIIMEHNPNASVLDIGCGNGDLLRYLSEKNQSFSLTGIDLYENKPIEGIEFINCDFLGASFNKKYDIVISLATIEHIQNITAFAQKAGSICGNNGLVIIMTVNESGFINRLARLFKRYFLFPYAYNRLYSQHHLNHFNTSSLRKLIEMNQLQVEKVLKHNNPIRAVDMGNYSKPIHFSLLSGIAVIFFIGKITGNTFLQTIICRK
jgi:2-polyprenyl-3-methyl-5-hydroxy-6-metoxy-1,4-benzoquinol methylase